MIPYWYQLVKPEPEEARLAPSGWSSGKCSLNFPLKGEQEENLLEKDMETLKAHFIMSSETGYPWG